MSKAADAIRAREQRKLHPEPPKKPRKASKAVLEAPEPASAEPVVAEESDG